MSATWEKGLRGHRETFNFVLEKLHYQVLLATRDHTVWKTWMEDSELKSDSEELRSECGNILGILSLIYHAYVLCMHSSVWLKTLF